MDLFRMKTGLKITEQHKLHQVVNRWFSYEKSALQVFDNLEKDTFIKSHIFQEIVNFLVKNHELEIPRLKKKLRSNCFSSWAFNGENVKTLPSFIATIIPFDRLVNFLMINYAEFFDFDVDEVKTFVRNLKYSKVEKFRKNLLIKSEEKLVWFFWNPIKESINPLSISRCQSRFELIIMLGLGHYRDERIEKEELIGFVFSTKDITKSQTVLKKPTWPDASLNKYWRPAPPNSNSGMTNPLKKKFRCNGKEYKVSPIPECIGRSSDFPLKFIDKTTFY